MPTGRGPTLVAGAFDVTLEQATIDQEKQTFRSGESSVS